MVRPAYRLGEHAAALQTARWSIEPLRRVAAATALPVAGDQTATGRRYGRARFTGVDCTIGKTAKKQQDSFKRSQKSYGRRQFEVVQEFQSDLHAMFFLFQQKQIENTAVRWK